MTRTGATNADANAEKASREKSTFIVIKTLIDLDRRGLGDEYPWSHENHTQVTHFKKLPFVADR